MAYVHIPLVKSAVGLIQDSQLHGEHKTVGINIGLLRFNDANPFGGKYVLNIAATNSTDAPHLLNKNMQADTGDVQ